MADPQSFHNRARTKLSTTCTDDFTSIALLRRRPPRSSLACSSGRGRADRRARREGRQRGAPSARSWPPSSARSSTSPPTDVLAALKSAAKANKPDKAQRTRGSRRARRATSRSKAERAKRRAAGRGDQAGVHGRPWRRSSACSRERHRRGPGTRQGAARLARRGRLADRRAARQAPQRAASSGSASCGQGAALTRHHRSSSSSTTSPRSASALERACASRASPCARPPTAGGARGGRGRAAGGDRPRRRPARHRRPHGRGAAARGGRRHADLHPLRPRRGRRPRRRACRRAPTTTWSSRSRSRSSSRGCTRCCAAARRRPRAALLAFADLRVDPARRIATRGGARARAHAPRVRPARGARPPRRARPHPPPAARAGLGLRLGGRRQRGRRVRRLPAPQARGGRPPADPAHGPRRRASCCG